MPATLVKDQSYSLKIKNLLPAAEPFNGNGVNAGKKFFAHELLLVNDLGDEFNAQICDLNNSWDHARIGDIIEVKIGSVSQNKYTVKFNRVVKAGARTGSVVPANPLVTGTAAAVALQMTIQFFQFNEETETITVASVREEFFNWLKDKTNS